MKIQSFKYEYSRSNEKSMDTVENEYGMVDLSTSFVKDSSKKETHSRDASL